MLRDYDKELGKISLGRPEIFRQTKVKLVFALCVVVMTLTTCGPVDEPKSKVVLIFSDVTNSLLPTESVQVATITANVLEGLPPGTQYWVYPIQIEPERLLPIEQGILVSEKTPDLAKAVNEQRRSRLRDEIEALYQLIKPAKAQPSTYGRPDNHTCILYTLDFADKFFRQYDSKKNDLELIYISDMVEECNNTPMRQPISLASGDISAAIKLAKETDLKLDLSHARISIIIPATKETYVAGLRPNVSDLRVFWESVFMHCGFDSQALQDDKRFHFSSALPARFESSDIGK